MNTSTYDTNCQVQYGYNASGTLQNTTTTCDNPVLTQTGWAISFLEISILVYVGFWFLMFHGKKNLS